MSYRPYGPPGAAPPPSYAPYGAPGAPPGAPQGPAAAGMPPTARPGPAFLNPSTGAPAPPASASMGMGVGVPAAAAPSGYGYAPPPPSGASAAPVSAPPSGYAMGYAPPGPPTGLPAAPTAPASAPGARPGVQFFSTAGGAPTLSVPTAGPPSAFGAPTMPPPPTAGPPAVGPPTGPPTGLGAPLGGPMGAQGMPYGGPMGAQAPMAMAPQQPTLPAGFDSGTNLAAQGVSDLHAPSQSPFPSLDELDLSIQCHPSFLRASVGKLVSSQSAAAHSRVPLGVVVRPMAGDVGVSNENVEVVDFGATGIVRCKRCRTYINPYVTWTDNGRRWRCNICAMLNDVPSTYFSHLDAQGQRRDRDTRPELRSASVEFVAPGDYMVRPPVPPVYFFVLDVSQPSVASGMLQHACNAVKSVLDELTGRDARTQIGFLTFDAHIHFYNLKSSLSSPQMLCVSDVSDVIVPLPEDLLVNLQESRSVVETLLDSLPAMFKSGSASSLSCMGPALLAAKRVIQHVGGKLLLFQSALPAIGEGALKMRENPRLLGTDKEHTLLNAEDPWYKTNAIEFSRIQVAVDTFLFSSQYTDLATVSTLSKYTGGSTYYYPAFTGTRDGEKFEKELAHTLTRSTAFEAVMRVRATRGIRFSNFYGNHFIRGTDLLALPNCTSDSVFALDMSYDEAQLATQCVTVQAALLYTNAQGERRIRVHTMVLPVTHSASEMLESVDVDATMNLLAKQSIDIALKTGLENARQRVHQSTIEMLRAAKMSFSAPAQQRPGMPGQPAPAPQVSIPQTLLLLPLYAMSLQKSLLLRGGSDVRTDERAFVMQCVSNMDVEQTKVFIYPRMFSLHDMTVDVGLPCENPVEGDLDDIPTAGSLKIRLPVILNLSYERLSSEGVFLLENGLDLFLWIGRAANPAVIATLFGVSSLEGVDLSRLQILSENSDFSLRTHNVVSALREERLSSALGSGRHMQLHFIREGDGYAEAYFARYLIEDRANFSGGGMSYTEYHALITRSIG